MIALYQLHWSHYVEKVAMTLDQKGIPWRAVNVNAFSKKEMRHFDCRQYVPLIHNEKKDVALDDSSKIIKYLDEEPSAAPSLFPGGRYQAAEIYQWMLSMDTCLGLPARRIAYAQMLMNKPTLMAELFLADMWGGLLNWPIVRQVSSAIVGMILTTRFRLHRNREDGIYPKLEQFLLVVVEKLGGRKFLFGETLTAADLTLAALMRPLRISPYFMRHPKLISLFQHQLRISRQLNRPIYPYEKAIDILSAKEIVHGCNGNDIAVPSPSGNFFSSHQRSAANDQRPVYHWRFLLSPYFYMRLKLSGGNVSRR